jgi:hypothetical protein
VVRASQRFNLLSFKQTEPLNPIATINASIDEFLHVLGFAIYTSLNRHLVCFTSSPISFPRNTLAIKFPEDTFRRRMAILRADKTS